MSKRTPKNHTKSYNTPVVLCWHEKKIIESNKRQWISFRPGRSDVPYRNHHACCEKLLFVRSIYPNLPKWDEICTMACRCRSMIAFQVSWISAEFWFCRIEKPGISSFYRESTVPWFLKFFPISCMGPKHAPKDTDLSFQPIYMHRSMCM